MHSLTLSPEGLTLAGVMLARRAPDGSLALTGREGRIRALLTAAYGPLSPHVMNYIRRVSELLRHVKDKDWDDRTPHLTHNVPPLARAYTMLSLTGLNGANETSTMRMRKSEGFLDKGMLPEMLIAVLEKDIGDESGDEEDDGEDAELDSASQDEDGDPETSSGSGHYNPDEPRIPAGQSGGGQWTTGDGTTTDSGSISADDVRNTPGTSPSSTGEYQVAQRTDVATDAQVNNGSRTPTATSADTNDDGHVVIQYDDGSSEVRSDGSVAWRNNNPGNLRAGDFADNHGAVGEDANGFAIFPDEATGDAAQAALLNTPSYSQLTVDQAIARRSPNNENDTANLQQSIQQISGLTGSERISDLTPEQFSSLTNAIRRTEGWQQGTAVTQRAQGQ